MASSIQIHDVVSIGMVSLCKSCGFPLTEEEQQAEAAWCVSCMTRPTRTELEDAGQLAFSFASRPN